MVIADEGGGLFLQPSQEYWFVELRKTYNKVGGACQDPTDPVEHPQVDPQPTGSGRMSFDDCPGTAPEGSPDLFLRLNRAAKR